MRPSCRIIPPINCTSKWRCPSMRLPASRQVANASTRMSSRLVPAATCCLNASVRARSASSDSFSSSFSSPLIAATRGRYDLIRRSLEEPNSLRASATDMLRVKRTSFQIEADRHVEIHVLARPVRRRRRERLCAAQQRQRLLVERGRARRAHETTVEQPPLPVEAEKDLGDALFTARAGRFRIALVAQQRRNELRPPAPRQLRIVGIGRTLPRRRRYRSLALGNYFGRGGDQRRALLPRRRRFLLDLLGRGRLHRDLRIGRGLHFRRRLFDRLRVDLLLDFRVELRLTRFLDLLLLFEALDRLDGGALHRVLLRSRPDLRPHARPP